MVKLPVIRIGTRKSALALAQANELRARLIQAWPELADPGRIEIMGMSTSGDEFLNRPLSEIGGKGLFTKEIEEALLDKRVDLAIHSVKDMQTVLPDGLILGCMLERQDARDVLVGTGLKGIQDLPKGAVFGTSSLRRQAQVLIHRKDIQIVPLRGNVQTRLAKVEKGEITATALAAAGLNRLGLTNVPGGLLPVDEFMPAVGQGALGIEYRKDNEDIHKLLEPLSHLDTEIAVHCERAFLRVLDGSCRTPIAGFAYVHGDHMHMYGLIARPDGSQYHVVDVSGAIDDAIELGQSAGEKLLSKAGKNFLG